MYIEKGLIKLLFSIPITIFVISAITWLFQGGFYGGDRIGDKIIAICSLPYSLVNWPNPFSDILRLLIIPLACNSLLILFMVMIFNWFKQIR